MRFHSTLLCLLFCAPTFAEDLRDRALQEIQQPGKYQSRSTNATVDSETGMLSLKDPMPEIRGRRWDYFARFAIQAFEPSGNASNDLTPTQFDLSKTSVAIMPALTVGVRSGLVRRESWTLGWGLGARVSYTSQKGSACFNSGFCEPQSQLNTLMLAGVPELTLSFARFAKWSFNLGAEVGNLNYTQSSGNSFANFSVQSPYAGATAGAEYQFGKYWSALASYTHRELTKNSRIGIQADNFELGTRFAW